jgi:hypothetical protein
MSLPASEGAFLLVLLELLLDAFVVVANSTARRLQDLHAEDESIEADSANLVDLVVQVQVLHHPGTSRGVHWLVFKRSAHVGIQTVVDEALDQFLVIQSAEEQRLHALNLGLEGSHCLLQRAHVAMQILDNVKLQLLCPELRFISFEVAGLSLILLVSSCNALARDLLLLDFRCGTLLCLIACNKKAVRSLGDRA